MIRWEVFSFGVFKCEPEAEGLFYSTNDSGLFACMFCSSVTFSLLLLILSFLCLAPFSRGVKPSISSDPVGQSL